MSFDNARKARMDKMLKYEMKWMKFELSIILELLAANPQGLTLRTIAKQTGCLREITKKRLELYIDELRWSGEVIENRKGLIKLRK